MNCLLIFLQMINFKLNVFYLKKSHSSNFKLCLAFNLSEGVEKHRKILQIIKYMQKYLSHLNDL